MTAEGNGTRIPYRSAFVGDLAEDIARLIDGESQVPEHVEARLRELARANSEQTAMYWSSHSDGLGVPDSAYKTSPPYLFPDTEPARTFVTSMTTGTSAGRASYTPLGMQLMELSIVRNAGRQIMRGLDEPAVIRLVPSEPAAPAMVMAYGMELIARRFGSPQLSACVVSASGIDHGLLRRLLNASVAEQRPVVLIGGTSVFVNACEALRERRIRWTLPPGSRLVDAGGHKRARQVTVGELRGLAAEVFGIGAEGHRNLFGMTELASQLYDASDVAVGPSGERPKGSQAFVRAQVRDTTDLSVLSQGTGLLEVIDLCLIDRPCAVLTGDWAIATTAGTAIVGRVAHGRPRGCSLALDNLTTS